MVVHVTNFIFISVTQLIFTSLFHHTAKRDVEEYLIVKGMKTQWL
ncbi:hypothetical protein NRIC_14670 [Enterococcus florum]|uniref:Uncharacterized protein n=1 Tax=Enterococcus florum TaxID=2480627 RepID=A0A4P5P7U5_9ENTE|nr:hypothetical protein [Enterococcus florum]GCF93576.1 hypothetical protein NRIC_14670 [Enterococcus florum]